MKKILAIILVVVLTLSLFGCKGNSDPTVGTTDPTVTTEPTLGEHEHDHGGETTNTTEGTEATEGTTDATEATTEPTEETTEPSTEATEPSNEQTVPGDPGDIGNGGAPDTPGQNEHKHSYTTKVIAPTCESKGYTEYTCACGDSYKSNETKATGHSYTSKTVAPTASAEGYDQHTCSKCGHSYKDNYKPKTEPNPTEHQHNYKANTVEPTCESKGYTEYTCSCGDSYRGNETKATGHKYTTKTVAPTASAEGYDIHTCSKCGDSYKDNYTPKTGNSGDNDHTGMVLDMKTQQWVYHDCATKGHAWEYEWTTIRKATCGQTSLIERHCRVVGCNAVEQKEGKKDSYHTRSVNDIGEITGYHHSYEVRTSSGASTYFSDEAQWKAFARQIVNDFKSGKSTEYVHRLRHDYITERNTPKEFVCTKCGQTVSDSIFLWDGEFQNNTERIYEEYFTKENQPNL